MGWQPIETAPRDGQEIITWHDYRQKVANPIHPHFGKRGRALVQRADPGIFMSEAMETGAVTHWSPIIEPSA